jgi:hypothetical protein
MTSTLFPRDNKSPSASTFLGLTICTITYNNDPDLYSTLQSVEKQTLLPYQLIIKDGCVRNAPLFLHGFSFDIIYLPGPDRGIYDAMNHCIDRLTSSFVLFLNSGDVLHSDCSLADASAFIESQSTPSDIYFFGWSHIHSLKLFKPNSDPFYFNHQSVVYHHQLHLAFGRYLAIPGFTAADYLFFSSILYSTTCLASFSNIPIAAVDALQGASVNLNTRLYVACIRFLFRRSSRMSLLFVGLFHPLFRLLLSYFQRFL